VPQLGARAANMKQHLRERLVEHRQYIRQHGEDMPAADRFGVDPAVADRLQ
jgi:phosphoketolase